MSPAAAVLSSTHSNMFAGASSLGGLLNRVSLVGAPAGQWDTNGVAGRDGNSVGRHTIGTASTSTTRAGSSSSHQQSLRIPTPSPPIHGAREFPSPLDPRSYTILKEVGDGSFGTVWLVDWHSALQLPPGTLPPGLSARPEYKGKTLVAIKRMKKAFEGGWDECLKLKELKSLREIPMHANIIPLYDAFLLPSTKELYFVFECMEGNLYQLTKSRKGRPLASGLIASIFEQILSGLDHIHRHGFFHRDMKPENLLITTTGLADYPASSLYALPGTPAEKDVVVVVKLADFGLARETRSKPPYTEYVSTRWYRAPEVLLRSRDYSNPVDMWALGTILVEVVTLKPLFPGDSEVDQVYKICQVLGDPADSYGYDEKGRRNGGGPWPEGVKMAKGVGFGFPLIPPRKLASLFDPNTVPVQLIDCIADLLRYDPNARLTTQQCLDHAYFREVAYRFAPYRQPSVPTTPTSMYLPAATSSRSSATLALVSPRIQSDSRSSGSPAFYTPPLGPESLARLSLNSSHFPFPEVPNLPRQYSVDSVTGMSGYGVQIMPQTNNDYDSPMSNNFPQEVEASGRDSFVSQRNGDWTGDQAWRQQVQDRPVHAFGAASVRRQSFTDSLAGSTFYDGSVFEGITPSRAASVMSFPVGYSALDNQRESPDDSRRANAPLPVVFAPPPPQQPVVQAPPPQKSRSWGFGSVFSGDKNNSSPSPLASHQEGSLTRTPSTASVNMAYELEGPRVHVDPKKAKKEAEKAAKEAEKLKREAIQLAARERARAVMKKKNQLMEAADPLHSYPGQHSRTIPVDKGKARSADRTTSSSAASTHGSMSSHKLPQIHEHTGRPSVADMRHKSRRRDDDDDVHSVSSVDTGLSSQRGRPASISSQATSRSDPEKSGGHYRHDMGSPSLSSLRSGSSSIRVPHHSHYFSAAPNTGASSVDHQLAKNMQGLATGPGWRSPAPSERSERSESRGHRSTSPETRYNPYTFQANRPSASHGPTYNTFAEYSSQFGGHLGLQGRANDSSAASIASYHSTPGVLPSHYHQQQRLRDETAKLPYLPSMDPDSTPRGLFPYPNANHQSGQNNS